MALPTPTVEHRIAADLAEHGWSVRHDFVDADLVAALAAECRALWEADEFRAAEIGIGATRRRQGEVRGDYIHWLDEATASPAQRRYLAAMESLRLTLNETLFLGLFSLEAHLAVYPVGAGYERHLDQFAGARTRVVSCVLYLNTDWRPEDGGQLRLFLGDDERPHDIPPTAGTLATFMSASIYHSVLSARRQRLSLTGWFRIRES